MCIAHFSRMLQGHCPKLSEWVVNNDRSLVGHLPATCRPLMGCDQSWRKGENWLSVEVADTKWRFHCMLFSTSRSSAEASDKWLTSDRWVADKWPMSDRLLTTKSALMTHSNRLGLCPSVCGMGSGRAWMHNHERSWIPPFLLASSVRKTVVGVGKRWTPF